MSRCLLKSRRYANDGDVWRDEDRPRNAASLWASQVVLNPQRIGGVGTFYPIPAKHRLSVRQLSCCYQSSSISC